MTKCISMFHLALLAATTSCFLCVSTVSQAASGEKLASTLSRKMPALTGQSGSLRNAVARLFQYTKETGLDWRDEPNIGIEYDAASTRPNVRGDLSEGTLGEQLDKLAESAGYECQANGDWINFVPRTLAADPDYVMNKRIPGKVVISRDPTKATSYRGWLDQQKISVAREAGGLRWKNAPRVVASIGTDPIELENPTLRELFNAHESIINGNNVWTVQAKKKLSEDGKSAVATLLLSWGQNTHQALEDPSILHER